jgi:phosphoglycerol transferase MdoB-like AlkP superfamily enzyme
MFQWTAKQFIPNLLEQSRPFVLHLVSTDTHPWPRSHFERTPYIDQLKKEGYPRQFLAFTWLDEVLRRFVANLEKLGLNDDNTVLVFVPDHLLMSGWESLKNVDRNLSMIFPWRKQDELWKRGQKKFSSLYDFAPTILDLLGVKYEPPFPWGANVFGKESGTVPTEADFRFIYGMTTGDYTGRTAMCARRKGFCDKNQYGFYF